MFSLLIPTDNTSKFIFFSASLIIILGLSFTYLSKDKLIKEETVLKKQLFTVDYNNNLFKLDSIKLKKLETTMSLQETIEKMNILEKQRLKNKLDFHYYEVNQDGYDRYVKLLYLFTTIGIVILGLCSFIAPFYFLVWHRDTQKLFEKKNEIELKTLINSEQYIEKTASINIKNSQTTCELNEIELEIKRIELTNLRNAGNLQNPSLPVEQ